MFCCDSFSRGDSFSNYFPILRFFYPLSGSDYLLPSTDALPSQVINHCSLLSYDILIRLSSSIHSSSPGYNRLGGATTTELDTNEVTTTFCLRWNTIAVLPHSYSVTLGVLLSSKPSSEAVIVLVLDTNEIPATASEHSEGNGNDSRTTLVAQNVIQ